MREGLWHKLGISIHALREESDSVTFNALYCVLGFQSTLSVRRATKRVICAYSLAYAFQSTLSVRRATAFPTYPRTLSTFQSTLSVRRATDYASNATDNQYISIHALREESDANFTGNRRPLIFQSTLSVRRATDTARDAWFDKLISIHALREESDCAAGHFCPLFETQASCLALRISNNTAGTTNNIPKTSNWLSVSFLISTI